MYDPTDPRSTLQKSAASAAKPAQPAADAEYGLFYKDPPQEDDANGRTWYSRGQNFVVAYSEAKPGASFERKDQIDEWMVLVPDHDTPFVASAAKQEERGDGYSVLVMPPGASKLTFPKGGRVVRIFTSRSKDIADKCANAASYAEPHANIPPFEPWPDPVGGYKVRVYSLNVPKEPGRLGRIWRCTTFMINYPELQIGARDTSKLSPHYHDDFEQCSLLLAGTYIHHMRWPWTVDQKHWREDVHAVVDSPSITVIPPPVIHTSVGTSAENQLIDIFSPPRVDFSLKAGWVLNADEYPMPAKH
ncbi:MAG TPA: hypothetical protein VG943_09945 [Caulobacterales bacterium]|nr:hypothetical protein [Caulobacterales bacterium]